MQKFAFETLRRKSTRYEYSSLVNAAKRFAEHIYESSLSAQLSAVWLIHNT